MNKAGKGLRLAVIGFGAITEEIVRCLDARGELDTLLGVLDLPQRMPEVRRKAAGRFAAVDQLDALLDLGADLVVECAGHGGIKQFGPGVVARGVDLMIASVGALADRDFAAKFVQAVHGNAQIWIPSGAVAGIDGLLAARTAGGVERHARRKQAPRRGARAAYRVLRGQRSRGGDSLPAKRQRRCDCSPCRFGSRPHAGETRLRSSRVRAARHHRGRRGFRHFPLRNPCLRFPAQSQNFRHHRAQHRDGGARGHVLFRAVRVDDRDSLSRGNQAMGKAPNPVLVEVIRGDDVESVHRGAAAIVDARGHLVAAWGEVNEPIFPRSAIKPIQALPLIETGAAANTDGRTGGGTVANGQPAANRAAQQLFGQTRGVSHHRASSRRVDGGLHSRRTPRAAASRYGARRDGRIRRAALAVRCGWLWYSGTCASTRGACACDGAIRFSRSRLPNAGIGLPVHIRGNGRPSLAGRRLRPV